MYEKSVIEELCASKVVCIIATRYKGQRILGPALDARGKQMDSKGLTFEVQKRAVLTTPRLTLTNDHSRGDLFPELRLTLLHGSENLLNGKAWGMEGDRGISTW